MLCRRLIMSITRKRCFHFSLVQASNLSCGYAENFDESNYLGHSIHYNEISNRQRNLTVIKRFKYNKKQSNNEEDEESEDEDDDIPQDKNSPVQTLKITSLRVDLILKAGLNIARNKVETAFYESKIRINGKKVLKKSERLHIGDEVDIVRGPSPMNPDFLLVSRIQILDMKENGDTISVKVVRNKSLVIENYEDPWKKASI